MGEAAAGALDDRDEGDDVEILQPAFDDDVGVAGRDHAVAVAVAAVAGEADGAFDPVVGVAVGSLEKKRRGGEEGGVGEPGAGARRKVAASARTAVPGASAVAGEPLAGEGLGHHAEHGLAVVEQPDQRSPDRHAHDEGARPVDGIEHPDELGVRTVRTIFLADDAVLGKGRGDQPAHGCFRIPVGGGDRVEASRCLVLDRNPCAKMRHDRIGGSLGEAIQEGVEGFKVHKKSDAWQPCIFRKGWSIADQR